MKNKKAFLLLGTLTLFWVTACGHTYDSHTHTHQPGESNNNTTTSVSVNPQQIISAHNKVRSRYNLAPLSWSNELAQFSTQWANHLRQAKGCNMHHRPHSGKYKTSYGENLFWASAVKWSTGQVDLQNITSTMVVNDWADEVKFYNYQTNGCKSGKQCGHYTQIVWHNTKKVGCGLAVCNDKSQVWVCSYDPPGNWQGERPY